MAKTPKPEKKKTVEALKHEEASRKNIPTAEFQSVMQKEQLNVRVLPSGVRARRNRDLDPQLAVWRGKDEQDWGLICMSRMRRPSTFRRKFIRRF